MAWTQGDGRPDYVFVANTDTSRAVHNFNIPRIPDAVGDGPLEIEFSTVDRVAGADGVLTFNGYGYKVLALAPGEGRVYRLVR